MRYGLWLTVARVGNPLREEAACAGCAYGERALPAGSVTATDALVWRVKAAAAKFRLRVWPGFEPDGWRFAPFVRRIGALRTRWLGRDDRPFVSGAPPAALFHFSRNRGMVNAGWGLPDPEGFYDGPMDAKKLTLEKLLNQTGTRTIQYVYDFGDDWDHNIRIERVNEAMPGMTYPRLLKAAGACPPEDVGGAWGYEEFLEALADPDHEQHEDMVRWSGGNFNAEDAGIDGITERIDRLAKKWAPRLRRPKTTI